MVQRATGWKLEVISGLEEGRLIYLGVTANTRSFAGAKRVLFVDLGGGSCELTLTEEGHIRQVFSLPLGAVRLTQEFQHRDPASPPELRRCMITCATRMTSRDAAFALLDELSVRDAKERAQMPGINAKRAEIILAGAMVFAELLRTYELPRFRYSPLGLRDGLLAQMAADLDQGTREYRHIEAEREDAIVALCKHYQVDLNHASHVRHLAAELFAGLKSLHKLPQEQGQILAAAAMLHECGYYVNRRGRHRHTWYLIVHSELLRI